MISTTNLPLTHLSTPSQKPISLSSSLFPSPSPLRLSSTTHFSHLFLHRKQPTHATPTTLTVKSMAPPKPGGKPKKGICYFLQFPLLGYSLFSSNSFWWLDSTVTGVVKLALEAGKATPAPPVGPALGSKGVNIMAFCKEYNAKTSDKAGYVIPVEITVYDVSNPFFFFFPSIWTWWMKLWVSSICVFFVRLMVEMNCRSVYLNWVDCQFMGCNL